MKGAGAFLMILSAAFFIAPPLTHATYRDMIGYPELQAELGVMLPDGSGVAVGHVEVDADDGSSYTYMPNTALTEFSGKTFNDVSARNTGSSSHATQVAQNFYGNNTSIAPGITEIDNYEFQHWIGSGFLRTNLSLKPLVCDPRVVNHSWAADYPGTSSDFDALKRLDYLVETDDCVQVVGTNNGSTNLPLMADSFNGVAVGLTNGNHSQGTTAVQDIYISGRTKPDVVAPGYSPGNGSYLVSWGVPMVSASAALLIQTSQDNPALSNGSYISSRNGNTIHHADTPEVIKAALMAGADRQTANPRGANITDYTVDTDNGLDHRFGAGQVNIYNSYHVIAAGEQDSIEDGGCGDIGRYGFDYDPHFGGLAGSNPTANYIFTASGEAEMLTLMASLVWNVDVEFQGSDSYATLFNLDLLLYDMTMGDVMIASSESMIDNTENLFIDLTNGHDYRLEVTGVESEFDWDYGLAWRFDADFLPGDADFDGDVDDDDLSLLLAGWGLAGGWGNGDFDGNGTINDDDLSMLLANWSGSAASLELALQNVDGWAMVPEPATITLLLVGLSVIRVLKRR